MSQVANLDDLDVRVRRHLRPMPDTEPEVGTGEPSVIPVAPCEFFVSGRDVVISTVLGSCVSVCLRDPVIGLGGMNHFLLPAKERASDASEPVAGGAGAYGSTAIARLIALMIARGARLPRLEAKVFGGGHLLGSAVGERNVEMAFTTLREHGIALLASDVGGPWSRRIRFSPRTGVVRLKRLAGKAVASASTIEGRQLG